MAPNNDGDGGESVIVLGVHSQRNASSHRLILYRRGQIAVLQTITVETVISTRTRSGFRAPFWRKNLKIFQIVDHYSSIFMLICPKIWGKMQFFQHFPNFGRGKFHLLHPSRFATHKSEGVLREKLLQGDLIETYPLIS